MSVLLSIKEKYADAILSGEKTIEVRKSFPKRYKSSFPVYLYQTMDASKDAGLVVGKVTCQAIYKMYLDFDAEDFRVGIGNRVNYYVGKMGDTEPIRGICITQEELVRYYGNWFRYKYENGAMRKMREVQLYGWMLSEPVRFERPLALDGFLDDSVHPIERAPQSWKYCWRLDGV